VTIALFIERLAERRDMNMDVTLFDNAISPQLSHQLVLLTTSPPAAANAHKISSGRLPIRIG